MINVSIIIISLILYFCASSVTKIACERHALLGEINSARHFGENCSNADRPYCDMKETLACINGTCACVKPLSMTYDPARGLCVGKAGQECVLHISEASVPPSKRIGPCVMFSTCEKNEESKNSTCRCWSSFYSDAETGLCIKRREYLQKCDNDEQCNIRKGFICNKEIGICTCDASVNRYNPDTERCVGLPNQDCSNVYRECTENHKCKSGVCRCKFKEVETANGTLLCDPVRHKYGKACGRFRGDCGDEQFNNLRCLDGKCRCKNPDYQIYDQDRRVCISKVGGPCEITSPVQSDQSFRNGSQNSKFNPDSFPVIQCISYADCVPLSIFASTSTPLPLPSSRFGSYSHLRGICMCGKTFIETKKGMCSIPFGGDCDTSPKNKKDLCATPLKCVSGTCGCPNEVDIYEHSTRKCAKSVGSLCWKDSSCVQNASCKQRNKSLPGRCKCFTKFKGTHSTTCV